MGITILDCLLGAYRCRYSVVSSPQQVVPVLLQTHRTAYSFLCWLLPAYLLLWVQIHLDVVFWPHSSIVNANLLHGCLCVVQWYQSSSTDGSGTAHWSMYYQSNQSGDQLVEFEELLSELQAMQCFQMMEDKTLSLPYSEQTASE